MTNNEIKIDPDQDSVLSDIVKVIKRPLTLVKDIEKDPFGVKIDNGNIIELGLDFCKLTELPESIGKLKYLKKLNLVANNIAFLPQSITEIPSIEYLCLKANGLIEIPEVVTKIKSLKILDLSQNLLNSLPEGINELNLLETLDISYNKFNVFPNTLEKCKSIKKLIFNTNNLSDIPKSIENMASLEEFDLRYNKFSKIPEGLSGIRKLKSLELGKNDLKAVPSFLANLQDLEILYLGSNKIEVVSEELKDLSKLKRLDLSSNNLKKVPDSLGNLQSLEDLYLGGNQLRRIPELYGNLQSLQEINLAKNRLDFFPGFLEQLKNLKSLDLEQNNLKELPESFMNLDKLSHINLRGNNWTEEWKEVASNDIDKIRTICKKLNGLNIFISHAWADQDKYKIIEFEKKLESSKTLNRVYLCEEDLIGDIWAFMAENVPKSQILIFLATQNSLDSSACRFELSLAKKYNIRIFPIKGDDIKWKDLKKINLQEYKQSNINLMDYEGLEYDLKDTEEFYSQVFAYIEKYEETLKDFKRDQDYSNKIKKELKTNISLIFNYKKLRRNIKENKINLDNLFKAVSNNELVNSEYLIKYLEKLAN